MFSCHLLPGQDAPAGPKDPSESRSGSRKKERSHPRFE